jgi:hypothetical protein
MSEARNHPTSPLISVIMTVYNRDPFFKAKPSNPFSIKPEYLNGSSQVPPLIVSESIIDISGILPYHKVRNRYAGKENILCRKQR